MAAPTFSNLIFDFDGTLVDSKRDIAGTQLLVLHQLGVASYSEPDLYPFIGRTLEETFTRLLPPAMHDRIPEAATMYSDLYPSRSLNTTTLFPSVRETLRELARRGARMAIASTKKGSGILRATNHLGITDFFAQLQGSDGLPYKPDPAILNKILEDQRWESDKTLLVGDTDLDMRAGRSAGLATCAVTYGSLTADELRPYHPDFLIKHFSELIFIVDPLAAKTVGASCLP